MRLLKRWRYLLTALVLIGVGGMAVAYFRSPGYRAAQAYARIQQGMNPDETRAIMREYGGEVVAVVGYSGIRFVEWDDDSYWFGGQCYVHLRFPPRSEGGPHCLVEKTLRTPTFSEWLISFFDTFRTPVQTTPCWPVVPPPPANSEGDAEKRMEELWNDPESQRQIREEWRRFKELDYQAPPTDK